MTINVNTRPILRDRPPKRDQFTSPRRSYRGRPGGPTGAIVIHTTEGAYTKGIQGLIDFVIRRDSAGSYHGVADRHQAATLVDLADEAYGVRYGANRIGTHLSYAYKARDWGKRPDTERAMLLQGAAWASWAMDEIRRRWGITVPVSRITADQFWDGHPGFISHAELDPKRRTDPGGGFPWGSFLQEIRAFQGSPARTTDEPKRDNVSDQTEQVTLLQQTVLELGGKLPKYGADGKLGAETIGAVVKLVEGIRADYANVAAALEAAKIDPRADRLEQIIGNWQSATAALLAVESS